MTTRTELNEDKQIKIQKEQQREKRKKAILLFLKITTILIFIMMSFYLYTTYVSTKSVIVKEERIKTDKLPDNFNSLKIIQISDIHYGTTIIMEDIIKIIKEINKRNPDLVIFTGDLISQDYKLKSKEQENLIKELKKLDTTIGKYAVSGEEDGENFITIMNQSGFNILNNDYDLIYKDNNQPLLLIGLASLLKDERNIDKAYNYFKEETHNSDIFTITIMHEPDSVDEILSTYNTDLFLAGHSHNGQINLPFIGGLIKKEGAINYNNEYYKLKNSRLYISSGLGTTDSGFRLFTRPSINFFRLSNY